MTDVGTEISAVTYNCATERFEALVSFHGDSFTLRVAASVAAPITAEFTDLSENFLRDALKKINAPGALISRVETAQIDLPKAA